MLCHVHQSRFHWLLALSTTISSQTCIISPHGDATIWQQVDSYTHGFHGCTVTVHQGLLWVSHLSIYSAHECVTLSTPNNLSVLWASLLCTRNHCDLLSHLFGCCILASCDLVLSIIVLMMVKWWWWWPLRIQRAYLVMVELSLTTLWPQITGGLAAGWCPRCGRAGGSFHPCSGPGGACACTQTCQSSILTIHCLQRPDVSVSPGGAGVGHLWGPSSRLQVFCELSLESPTSFPISTIQKLTIS